jgi:hypothetical protein
VIPSVPLPPGNPPGPPGEAYPLQSEMSQNQKCHRTIECFTLTFSRRSFPLPSQAVPVAGW